jgi:hypothetical protein
LDPPNTSADGDIMDEVDKEIKSLGRKKNFRIRNDDDLITCITELLEYLTGMDNNDLTKYEAGINPFSDQGRKMDVRPLLKRPMYPEYGVVVPSVGLMQQTRVRRQMMIKSWIYYDVHVAKLRVSSLSLILRDFAEMLQEEYETKRNHAI